MFYPQLFLSYILQSSAIFAKNNDDSGKYQPYRDELKNTGVTDYSIYPFTTVIERNRAYASGAWVATRQSAEGKTFNLSGNISNVLEKQSDGTWKITMQSWN